MSPEMLLASAVGSALVFYGWLNRKMALQWKARAEAHWAARLKAYNDAPGYREAAPDEGASPEEPAPSPAFTPVKMLPEVNLEKCVLCTAIGWLAKPRYCAQDCTAFSKPIARGHLHMVCAHCGGQWAARPPTFKPLP